MNRKLIVFIISFVMGLVILIDAGKPVNAQVEDSPIHTIDQIIIKYKEDANLSQGVQAQAGNQIQRLNQVADASIEYFRPMSGDAHVLRLEQPLSLNDALALTARLAALPEVEYAEPDYIAYPMESEVTPNDPRYPQQWHYFAPTTGAYGINAPTAWDITRGNSNVYIAVLDTGITDHIDLANRWIGGVDLITNAQIANDGDGRDSNPHDPGDWITSAESSSGFFEGCPSHNSTWHGTHVGGTIGAATNNNLGVAGLNWVSKIVPVRVLGKCGNYSSDIADGIRWAAGLSVQDVSDNPYPAKVINMSLGGYNLYGCSATYQEAIDDAYGEGSVIVVSAGNSTANADYYQPASCDHVITVAATTRYGNRAVYSNYGQTVEISAPGGDTINGVLSTMNDGIQGPGPDSYSDEQGTSMAAPHVSGVASLMFSLNPSLTPDQVLFFMQSTVTAFPSGSSCSTASCGSGIVNAAGALLAVPDGGPGIPVLSAISNPGGVGNYLVDWNDVPNADEYTLQEDDHISFSSPTTYPPLAISQKWINASTAGTRYYRVRSASATGVSSWSNVVSTTVKPEAPDLDPIANPGNTDAYTITWSSEIGAVGYLLQESTTLTFTDVETRYLGAATQYQVTGQAGGTWYYRVRAYNDGGDSGWSDPEHVAVTFSTLSAPNLLPIVNPAHEPSFWVNWSDVISATSYTLEESDTPYFSDPVVVYSGPITGIFLTDRDGGDLYYRVRAFSATESSPWGDARMTDVVYKTYLPVTHKDYRPPAIWNTITTLDFEGAFPGDWQIYPASGAYYWGKSSCQAYSGSYSGWAMGGGTADANCGDQYPNSANMWLHYGPFDLSSAQSAELVFQRWYYTENDYDRVCWMASVDDLNYYGYCASGNSAGWGSEVLDLTNVHSLLPDMTGYSSVWVAFLFTSDEVFNYANGVFVDDVILRSCDGICESTSSNNTPVSGVDRLKIPAAMQLPRD